MNNYQETLNVLKKKEEENNYKQIGLFSHPQCDILQELVDAWEVIKNSTIQIKETFVDKDGNDNVVITIVFKEKDFGTFEKALEVK